MTPLVLLPAFGEIWLALTALVLVLVAAFGKADRRSASVIRQLTIVSLLAGGWLVYTFGMMPALAFNGLFMTAPYMVLMKLLVIAGAVVVLIMGKTSLRLASIDRPEVPILMLLSVLGMFVMISANDLMVLYMGVELQSLPLYVLAAIHRDSVRSSEAGLKYFLLGALSSGLMLYGASLIYGFAGGTGYATIASALGAELADGAVVGMVFLIAGIAFKISAAPFHMWTPDVYEGSPTAVTAFFAIAPKLAAMALFLRINFAMLGSVAESWQQVIIAIAVLSMIVGALGAIMQKDIKRLMAYSSIAHMGYALVGMAAATEAGIAAVILYMTIYAVTSAGAFAVILSLQREGKPVQNITDLAGFSRSHPLPAAALMIFMFSMAGIPPLGGFFGKWFIFSAAVDAGLVPLAVIGVVASVIGAFYYIRIVKVMYVDELEETLDQVQPGGQMMVMISSAVLVVGFLFIMGLLRDGIAASASYVPFVAG